MDNELKQALKELDERIEQRFEQIGKRFDQTDERIRDTETKLLKAFYDWARPVDSRLNKTNTCIR